MPDRRIVAGRGLLRRTHLRSWNLLPCGGSLLAPAGGNELRTCLAREISRLLTRSDARSSARLAGPRSTAQPRPTARDVRGAGRPRRPGTTSPAAAQRGGDRGRGGARVGCPGDRAADDQQVGPALRASSGVATRAWSCWSAPAGRTPGVISVMSGPTSARTAATSCGEQTSPRAPAATASTAIRRTTSLTEPGDAESRRGRCRPSRSAGSPPRRSVCGRRLHGRRIMSAPPAACTVRISGRSRDTARAAPATVAGMSCSLRSRKTSDAARAAYRGHHVGAVPQVELQADLDGGHVRRDERRPPRRGVQVRRVERDGDRCWPPGLARQSPLSGRPGFIRRGRSSATYRTCRNTQLCRCAGVPGWLVRTAHDV